MAPDVFEALRRLAAKYIWWKDADAALIHPQRVIAQVMDIGDYSDVQALDALIGDAGFRLAFSCAATGWLSDRSWAYWRLRLGLTDQEAPVSPPRRRFE